MVQKKAARHPIEQEIADVFRKLSKELPNASFVYSFVYATDANPKKAAIEGLVNMTGSAEEIAIHLEELATLFVKEKEKGVKRKAHVYGTQKN